MRILECDVLLVVCGFLLGICAMGIFDMFCRNILLTVQLIQKWRLLRHAEQSPKGQYGTIKVTIVKSQKEVDSNV